MLQTPAASEAVAQIERLAADPQRARAMRRAGANTARRYAWPTVIQRNLLPQLELAPR